MARLPKFSKLQWICIAIVIFVAVALAGLLVFGGSSNQPFYPHPF